MSQLQKIELTLAINRSGLKETPQRLSLLRVVEQSERPLSGEELVNILGEGKIAHKATVYRDIHAFVNHGLVNELAIRGMLGKYYESIRFASRPHFVCQSCGLIRVLDGKEMEDEIEMYTKQLNAERMLVRSWGLKLYGICELCVTNQNGGIHE